MEGEWHFNAISNDNNMLVDRNYAYKEPDEKAYKCKYCKGENLIKNNNDKYKLRTWYYDCCHCHRRNHIYGKDIWLGVLLIVLLVVKAFLSI